jgi:hypothetical protein
LGKAFLLAVLVAALPACASWVYSDPRLAGTTVPAVKVACESEMTHTVLMGLNQKLFITHIDGKSTSKLLTLGPAFPEAAEVAPGRRYLGLMYGQLNTSARGQVWFDAEPGKSYLVRKALKQYSVFFWVEEVGTGKVVGGIPGSEPERQADAPVGGF